MVERLAVQKVRVCRVGHPARLLPDVVRHSLDYMVQHHDNASIVDDIRNDMSDALFKMRQRGVNRSERLELRTSMKQLRKELNERESKTTEDILMHSQVVACTLTGSAARDVFTLPLFDLVVIDEAAQALESACWIALLKGKRAVLAGDHKQLPPTIKSHQAESGLGVTLFDRLATLFGGDMMHMLTTQYRMNEAIMQWSSNELYDGKLVAADSVKRHRLCDLPGVKSSRETITPFVFVDTAGCNLSEADDSVDQSSQTTGIYSMSKRNEGEASIVCKYVRLLVAVRPSLSRT
jgi:ATP-dependent RNA/DNA helicase IGHMBP2